MHPAAYRDFCLTEDPSVVAHEYLFWGGEEWEGAGDYWSIEAGEMADQKL